MRKLTKEFTNKDIKQLLSEEQKLRQEIGKMRLETKAAPQKDTNALMKKRKKLAVVLTVLSEKREIEKLEKGKK